MLRLTLDLVNFDYKKNSSVIKKFLRHVPKKEVFVSAVVGLAANKKKVKSFGVKKVCGTGGSLLYDTDVFISFGDCDYVNISAFLVKKNIFSVCYKEVKKTNCFDLVIDDDSLFKWEYIKEQYNRHMKKTEKKYPNKHMKVAFVTPLAEQSAIAEYSELTLKEFCKLADVDVYSLEKSHENTFGAKNVFYLSPFPYLSNDYDAVITVVGDSPFHDKMLKFSMLYGGYTICHDANLLNYSYAEFGPQYLKNVSKFYHNKTVNDKDIMFYLRHFDKLPFTAVEPVIESSRIMFTHSKVFADSAKSNNVKYLPFCVHADIDTSKLNDAYKKQAKQELGFKETDIIITSFGGVTQPKMSDFIARAFINAKLPDNVYLVFVGNAAYYPEFIGTASKCNNIKYFTGFVSKDIYNKYLYASDFSIQLRNSTNGQVSGALADNIQAKLYTISCYDLTASIEAPSYIHSLPKEFSISDLTKEIQNTLDTKIYAKDFSKECKEYLSEHNFKTYAEILLKYLKEDI